MIYDISVYIKNDMLVYPGDPKVEIIKASSVDDGDSSSVSILHFGSHTGTHVDPPKHMISGGKSLDSMLLDSLIGKCFVCDMRNISYIDHNVLESAGIPMGIERILFRTDNSDRWNNDSFYKQYTYLTPDGADWLLSGGFKLAGIDSLSIEQFHSGHHGAHLRLLGSDVVILEGLDLSGIEKGIYELICLPLKIKDGDGSPARAVLRDLTP